MQKICVAMVIQKYYPFIGGAERQLQALSSHLKKRGIDIVILARRYQNLPAFEIVDDIPVYRLPAPGNKAIASFVFVCSALNLIRKLHPQIVHAHEILSPATVAEYSKRLYSSRTIVKILGGGLKGDIHKLKNRPFGQQRIASLRKNIDVFVSVSREIDAELAGIGIPDIARFHLPNGVDTDHFSPPTADEKRLLRLNLGLAPASPVVIYSGRLHRDKRVDLLLDVWPSIRSHYQDSTLVVVGSGDEEDALRKKMSEGVKFIGQVNDVVPYLKASDLYIMPSAREGLSNSLLEAMSIGLPVAATAVGGTPDVIKHQSEGWLFPPNDFVALRDALMHLLENPDLRISLGQHARMHILAHYSLDAVADSMIGLYEKLLASRA